MCVRPCALPGSSCGRCGLKRGCTYSVALSLTYTCTNTCAVGDVAISVETKVDRAYVLPVH